MVYCSDAMDTYKALLKKKGAEELLSELVGIMSDELFEMYMRELGEGQ